MSESINQIQGVFYFPIGSDIKARALIHSKLVQVDVEINVGWTEFGGDVQ